ncbi:YbaB/EbfC family nucleoid-associated protein [Nonomuraea sp. CA-141351]|uniref:YbaB/EbfC family nucleoid-associated protein n=1 Tax=Nonomuraea sp. CA-141351 TaxID=3239996 RepID=UPI003D8BBA7A
MYQHNFDPADIRQQDLEEVARQQEQLEVWLDTAQEDLEKIVGTGERASGQVKASVDFNGQVLDVTYGPRALRLSSHELAEETLAAVSEACADVERQLSDLMRAAMPGYDPAEASAHFEQMLNAWR